MWGEHCNECGSKSQRGWGRGHRAALAGAWLPLTDLPRTISENLQTIACNNILNMNGMQSKGAMQKLRGELEAESQRLPEAHRLNASMLDRFMSNAKRSRLTQTGVGLAEFRALCEHLDMTAKQVRFG